MEPAARETAAESEAAAESAFRILEALTARAAAQGRTATAARGADASLPVALTFALRAALHPALAPFRDDPLRPLAGAYISLDARLSGLVSFARTHGLACELRGRLSTNDRRALRDLGLYGDIAGETDASRPGAGYVGEARAALFLSARVGALPCAVRAAYCPGSGTGVLASWPDPVPVRPVSESILASARAALSVALRLLSACGDLPAPLFPGAVYFDVSGSGLDDGLVAFTTGDSLGLPLALAFLSALSGVPLPSHFGATGAVAGGEGGPGGGGFDRVLAVAEVPAKADALALQSDGVELLLAAPGGEGADRVDVAAVETVGAAAARVSPELAALLASAASPLAEGVPPASGPGGVAFVATEIDGAARLWQAEPGAMRAAASDHARLVAAALARHGGYVFKERVGDGEGFLAAFARREDACAAALAVQRALRRHPWPRETGPLPVRVAVHHGPADLFKGDYFGPTLGQARRVLEAASGGQILVTAAARAADAAGQAIWSDLGRHRLRDLVDAVELFQLSAPDLPGAFDPPRTLDALRQNLPVQETPLMGRDAEVRMLAALLAGRSQRLTTLLGPGGVGKTRLALQAAADAVDSFPDGVFFVPVEEAPATPEGVASAIGDALRLGGGSGGGLPRDPVQGVLDALAGKRALLVLDNFESVLPGGAPFVAKLLANAPEVVCLVTSRALLLLSAERRFDVTPLALPGPDADEEEIRTADAVALFCARARAARPDFDPRGEEELRLLADVCRRLDGLPLAMELAAARLRHLTLPELSDRLADAFSVLTTRLRDVPPRHRTLAGTLEWSYGLLDPAEQRMLRVVSVFAGGFSARAAEAVSGDPDAAFDLLASLEDKSLVQCRAEDSREARYHLLNLVDEFARLKLRASGEEDAARAAHARWFLEVASALLNKAGAADEVSAFDSLESSWDNLRLAFAWLLGNQPEKVPEFVAGVSGFLRRRGHAGERGEWPRRALDLIATRQLPTSPETRSRLHYAYCLFLRDRGELEPAREAAEKALALGTEAEDETAVGNALNALGLVLVRSKRFEEAVARFQEAREHYRVSARPNEEVAALNNLGFAHYAQRDLTAAREYYEAAVAICRQSGDTRGLAYAVNNLGLVAQDEHDLPRARSFYEQYLDLSRKAKDMTGIAVGLLNLGEILLEAGEREGAAELLVAAEELLKRLGHRYQQQAEEYLGRFSSQSGKDYVAGLRKRFGRATTASLLLVGPKTTLALTLD